MQTSNMGSGGKTTIVRDIHHHHRRGLTVGERLEVLYLTRAIMLLYSSIPTPGIPLAD